MESPYVVSYRTSSSEACHHLISDEQCAVSARNVRDLPQPTRGLRNHSRCTLDQGFKNKRGIRIPTLLLRAKLLLNLADAFPVALAIFPRISPFGFRAVERAAVAIRRHYFVGLKQHSTASLVK